MLSDRLSLVFWWLLVTTFVPLLTRAVPGSDFNKHPKEQLSFGHCEGLLLILLLSEKHQTVPVL